MHILEERVLGEGERGPDKTGTLLCPVYQIPVPTPHAFSCTH